MEIKLSKGIKNGYWYEKVFVNGREMSFNDASLIITGTSRADRYGIFECGTITFIKRNTAKTFKFEETREFATPEYVGILKRRIAEVREWVKNTDCDRTISFSVTDP
jgi:hypothetical protein